MRWSWVLHLLVNLPWVTWAQKANDKMLKGQNGYKLWGRGKEIGPYANGLCHACQIVWKPRPCQDVRVWWTEVKHWALISCSCMFRVSSFSSLTNVFFSSFWLVWCRYKTTKPWEFLQREPSVSICFRVIFWQWCLPVNSSHKFKKGRGKKKRLT